MPELALFDFDKTITTRDSFLDFLTFTVGYKSFLTGILILSPLILSYKMGFASNSKAKEIMFAHFFRGWPIQEFKKAASDYSNLRLPDIVRRTAVERIVWHKSQGHKVVIISASIDLWLDNWCKQHDLLLIATELQYKDEKLTGHFSTANCYGAEKVNRLNKRLNLADFDYIYAYGDNRGDREMLQLANEKYYKWKKI
jgi:phosphatidylglycerophosphatase C